MVAGTQRFAFLIISALAAACLANQPDVVRVKNGLLQGVRLEKSRFFKGIPYAEPPIRDLRWRPPQPHAPWPGKCSSTLDFFPLR
jgi:para-nitrobenzyl esterase